jgi:kynurenine formamidase
MARPRLIDLSMEIYQGMPTYPSVAKPFVHELENHEQMARSTGAWQYGLTHAPNHCVIVSGDHIGTHLDSWGHVNPGAPRAEGIPLEYCYGPGVVLDLSHASPGEAISIGDVAVALARTGHDLQPLDIVLIRTDAARYRDQPRYLTDHPGMSKEAVHWLLDRGIKMMGIDAIGFDIPIARMFERHAFWEAHMVMLEREYYHLENLVNLDQIPVSHGFTVSVLPIPYRGASAAPVRAVAILPAD